MILKCITIHQPWASLIMAEIKRIETRRHKRFASLVGETIGIHASNTMDECARSIIDKMPPRSVSQSNMREIDAILEQGDNLPQGCLLGTVFVRSVSVMDAYHHVVYSLIPAKYIDGLFGFEMQDPRPFKMPIPMAGKQGIWKWEMPEGEAVS